MSKPKPTKPDPIIRIRKSRLVQAIAELLDDYNDSFASVDKDAEELVDKLERENE